MTLLPGSRLSFESLADKILVVEAPGAHPGRLDNLEYRNLRPGVRLGPGGPPHEPNLSQRQTARSC